VSKKLKIEIMENLIKQLTKQTISLKEQYLEMTSKWATEQVKRNIERKNKYFNSNLIDYPSKMNYYKEQKFAYNTPSWHFDRTLFVEKMMKNAELHYTDSIEKLAFRIMQKGMDISKMTMKYAHVGVNIDIILTDGTVKVKASTIIAGGPVQRPHYRYLVK
jgi:hypothetical protein